MKVMVIVKATKDSEAGVMPSHELLAAMGKYNQELAEAGIMLAGEGLHPSSKGARVRFDGKSRTVIDGPFAETKELIAGYWMWKVKSMAEAIEWLKKCPNPHDEMTEVEIRPVFSAEDFGAEFTPELREQEAAIRAKTMGLGDVRYVDGKPQTFVGLNASYTKETASGIPAQWQQFAPQIGKVPGEIGGGKVAYGVCWNCKEGCTFDYLAAVEVSAGAQVPSGLTKVEVPARRYVVFPHGEHVSALPKTLEKIWTQWVPECDLKIAKAPCFERYSEAFDPQAGLGGMEVWVPLEA